MNYEIPISISVVTFSWHLVVGNGIILDELDIPCGLESADVLICRSGGVGGYNVSALINPSALPNIEEAEKGDAENVLTAGGDFLSFEDMCGAEFSCDIDVDGNV